MGTCSIEFCGKITLARGVCKTHYYHLPDIKHRKRVYRNDPIHKAEMAAYNARQEQKQKRSQWGRSKAGKKFNRKRYRENPKYIAWNLKYKSSPRWKEMQLVGKLKREYGLTIEQYREILKAQNGVCAICEKSCGSKGRLSVDHCHRTKKIRGLLCGKCNTGIGMFGENQELLSIAISYLKKWPNH